MGAIVADDVNDEVEFAIFADDGKELVILIIVLDALFAVSEVTVCVNVLCDGVKVFAPETELADLPKADCTDAPKDCTAPMV